jgi:serine/threonine-protein kinase HipA
MQKAAVYHNDVLAGVLEKCAPDDYRFTYTSDYIASPLSSISLTLPKSRQEYHSRVLFSFFSGLLAEGINKDIQCRVLKIDEEDDFTRLLETAAADTIGAITIRPVNE